DPKVEKDLKKKFKYDGPLRVLHTMLVDPNSIIKKPGAKDLPVTQGEIVDVIQLTSSKKALCRNRFGKCMEQDIYDDVDYADGKFPFLYSAIKSSQTELLSFVIEVQV
uniref:Helically-extended SH3 domain-containing protein n=1 Tax=Neolamprologus brichardi TaxID=32507 RepID=A0A3Q4GP81_NEOBR